MKQDICGSASRNMAKVARHGEKSTIDKIRRGYDDYIIWNAKTDRVTQQTAPLLSACPMPVCKIILLSSLYYLYFRCTVCSWYSIPEMWDGSRGQ